MKKLALMATVAVLAINAPAHAEGTSWFQTMKMKAQSWFGKSQTEPTPVETYLDEVTIAVPPMTEEDPTLIEPAAGGDYDTMEQEMMDDQSYNNTPVEGMNGSSAAFNNPVSVSPEALADIRPAAGDAEEVTDEAIVVVEEGVVVETPAEAEAQQSTTDTMSDMADQMNAMAKETAEETSEVVDDAQKAATDAAEAVEETATDAAETVQDGAETAVDAAKDAAQKPAAEADTHTVPEVKMFGGVETDKKK